ncbi:MAG TPA: ribbon-helix-helix protein, CopG family [Candidatus Saccharimonadales bacterium]|nr:ribbon-helix-helix protein, CopG family [Candidatus Saccharimonadales bacterium]
MTVISFSIDDEVKEDVERIAKEERRSKSDVFRDMYDTYKFKRTLTKIQKIGRAKFMALGIESIDQAEEYLG